MKKFVKSVALVLVVAMCLALLAACGGGKPNSDPEKAKTSLEKKGYTVDIMTGQNDQGIEKTLVALKDGDEFSDNLTVTWFTDEASAKKAEAELSKTLSEYKQAKKDGLISTDYDGGRSGKMVWFGTVQAIKDAR